MWKKVSFNDKTCLKCFPKCIGLDFTYILPISVFGRHSTLEYMLIALVVANVKSWISTLIRPVFASVAYVYIVLTLPRRMKNRLIKDKTYYGRKNERYQWGYIEMSKNVRIVIFTLV